MSDSRVSTPTNPTSIHTVANGLWKLILYEIPKNTMLYLPASAVEKYRSHPDWQMFGRIEAIEN